MGQKEKWLFGAILLLGEMILSLVRRLHSNIQRHALLERMPADARVDCLTSLFPV